MFRKIQASATGSNNAVTYIMTQLTTPLNVEVDQVSEDDDSGIIDGCVKMKLDPSKINENSSSSTRGTFTPTKTFDKISEIVDRLRYRVAPEEWTEFEKYFKECAKKKSEDDKVLGTFNQKKHTGNAACTEKKP